jgi:Type VI secretion system (T6SS), amidase effector protein 4
MSLALIQAGVRFTGRLKIKNGPYKGRLIEPGAKLLADQLAQPQLLGKPQRLVNPPQAGIALHKQKGIIFFWKIDGYAGGHIDLIEESNAALICNSHCYFACKEVWFWPLR